MPDIPAGARPDAASTSLPPTNGATKNNRVNKKENIQKRDESLVPPFEAVVLSIEAWKT